MKSPRIQVSITDKQLFRDLHDIARLGGESMSSIIGNMVQGAAPTLHQIADTMRQLHRLQAQLPGATAQEIAGHLDMGAWKVSGGVDEMQDHLDQVQHKLDDLEATVSPRPSAGGERGGAGAASPVALPPSNNKGARVRGQKGAKG